jgi:Tfp pilus assembly protein PilN
MIPRSSSSRSRSARAHSAPQKVVRKLDADRQRLHQEAEEIRKLEEKIRQKEILARQRLETLPKELAERQRQKQELMRLHLVAAPTRADGISKLRDKRDVLRRPISSSGGKRLAERRAARMQFLLLCAVLLVILLLLWRSLPS